VWIGGTEIGAEDNYYWTNTGNSVEYAGWDDTEIVAVANRQVEKEQFFISKILKITGI
jgi:hypothetical protein